MQNNNFARASHFVYISLPFLHDYDVKMPKFAFYGASLKNQITIILFEIDPLIGFRRQNHITFTHSLLEILPKNAF